MLRSVFPNSETPFGAVPFFVARTFRGILTIPSWYNSREGAGQHEEREFVVERSIPKLVSVPFEPSVAVRPQQPQSALGWRFSSRGGISELDVALSLLHLFLTRHAQLIVTSQAHPELGGCAEIP